MNNKSFLYVIKKFLYSLSKKKKDKYEYDYIYLNKYNNNPIITPNSENLWESWQTFNPGVIFLNNRVHFIYRAIGIDGISRFGYAFSYDGFKISDRISYPVYQHNLDINKNFLTYRMHLYSSGGSWGGCEDPRIVRVSNENVLYMTYTVVSNTGLRMAITSINIDDFLSRKWNWSHPSYMSPPGENNKNWVIFPEKINGKYAVLHSITPKVSVAYLDTLNFNKGNFIKSEHIKYANKDSWDIWIRGAGAPPIKTKYGWLVFYHAMDNDTSKYKVGAMILDKNDPEKILYKAKNPIITPNKEYENNGFKNGIVYVSGAIVKDGMLLVYYGCSDSYVCVAYMNLDEFLNKIINRKEFKNKFRFNFRNLIKNKK